MNIDTTTISGEDMQETTTPSELIAICPDGDFWCDTPLEYPDRAILKAVNKQKRTFKEMFDTKLEKENFAMSENETLISTRNSFVEYEEEFTNICDVKTSYITPRAAKNKDGKFRFIVNHPDGDDEYIQLVRVAVCSGAGAECGGGRLAGAGVETRCQQEFSDHKLVTLGESGEELVVDTFSFPSCCTCLIGSDLLL